MSQHTHRFIKLFHGLCKLVNACICIGLLCVCLLAYGIEGKHLQSFIEKIVPSTVGQLTLQRLSFIPSNGIIIRNLHLASPEGKTLVRCSKIILGIRLFSCDAFQDRITAIRLDDLFVAQIEHDPNEPEDTWDMEHEPFPDLSGVKLPQFDNVSLHLTNPDILEVRLKKITGLLSTRGGVLQFHNLKGNVDNAKQHVDASVDVDIHGAIVTAHIRGHILQTRLNGIYRALDFPIIETYSNNFKLESPAWADCTFTVGFDKFRNIFDLKVDISAPKGSYCGVPFDEATGTIHCNGIWTAVTTIGPIIARRNGAIVAKGNLHFDCPNDRFTFEAEGSGLSASEALRLIDMPFTEAIPSIQTEAPPTLSIRGNIPLLTEQSPAKVNLQGSIRTNAPFTFDRLRLQNISTEIEMKDGVFHLNNLKAAYPSGGSIKGNIALAIPEDAQYTDTTIQATLTDANLADLLTPFEMNTLTNCVANGEVKLSVRTDETFAESLNATFDLIINGGLVGRLPLFAGFTDFIAETIPGVSTLTDTSTIHLQGMATNGLFNIPHFTLSGDVFIIEGPVTYNLPKNNLEARVIAGVFKKDTIIGNLTRWATVPTTRLLWELRVFGPLNNPDWENVTIIEKIWDKVPFIGGDSDTTQ